MRNFEPIPEETDRIASQVVDAALQVHKALGPGLLEKVYEKCLIHELKTRTIRAESQVELPIVYRGEVIESGLRLDLLVEKCIVIELKAVDVLTDVHEAQLLTYLKLSGKRLGFLMNFNTTRLKDGLRRRVL